MFSGIVYSFHSLGITQCFIFLSKLQNIPIIIFSILYLQNQGTETFTNLSLMTQEVTMRFIDTGLETCLLVPHSKRLSTFSKMKIYTIFAKTHLNLEEMFSKIHQHMQIHYFVLGRFLFFVMVMRKRLKYEKVFLFKGGIKFTTTSFSSVQKTKIRLSSCSRSVSLNQCLPPQRIAEVLGIKLGRTQILQN